MPAITTLIAIAGVAASVGGVVAQSVQAAAAAKAAKKQANQAKAALQAKKPSDTTEAKVRLATTDKALKRGKGSLAKRRREGITGVGGLPAASAATAGGL